MREQDNRIETGSLEGRGKQESRIEAGGETLVRDATGAADLLSVSLE